MFAGELARRWGEQGVIAVVGTLQLQGRPALIGTIYRAGGTIFRSAVTTLDGDRVTNIRSLAKYLADGTVSPELNVIPNGGKEPVRVLAARASLGPSTTPAKLVMTGVGLWLMHREGDEAGTSGVSDTARRHRASTPIIAAGPTHALLGWAATF